MRIKSKLIPLISVNPLKTVNGRGLILTPGQSPVASSSKDHPATYSHENKAGKEHIMNIR